MLNYKSLYMLASDYANIFPSVNESRKMEKVPRKLLPYNICIHANFCMWMMSNSETTELCNVIEYLCEQGNSFHLSAPRRLCEQFDELKISRDSSEDCLTAILH